MGHSCKMQRNKSAWLPEPAKFWWEFNFCFIFCLSLLFFVCFLYDYNCIVDELVLIASKERNSKVAHKSNYYSLFCLHLAIFKTFLFTHFSPINSRRAYRIAGFSCKDFNLMVWSIRNINIHEKFHYIK